jgi:hypothetical protein
MDPVQFALTLFGGLLLFALALPTLLGFFLFRGLERAKVEKAPWKLCYQVAFASTYMAILVLFLAARFLPPATGSEGRVLRIAIMASVQLLGVVVLMRKFTPRVLAIETAATAAANAIVVSLQLMITPPPT